MCVRVAGAKNEPPPPSLLRDMRDKREGKKIWRAAASAYITWKKVFSSQTAQ